MMNRPAWAPMLIGVAACASAQAAIIDSFATFQTITDNSAGSGLYNFASGPGIIGGTRRLFVIRSGSGNASQNITATADWNSLGVFRLATTSTVTGWTTLTYSGGTDVADRLGGVDLTENGTHDRFRIGVSFTNVPSPYFSLTVESNLVPAAGSGIYVNIPDNVSSPITIDVPFADFFPLSSFPADFTSVEQIVMQINADYVNTDIQLDYIITAPEPTSLALLGFGSPALIQRRRYQPKSRLIRT